MKNWILILAVGMLCLAPRIGLGQELEALDQASDDMMQFFASEAQVSAAAKHAQKTAEAPASVYIITADDIASYGYRTLAEALQSAPGIFSWTDRNYTYLSVRGFGRPGDYGNRILLLINGHRMNENVFGQIFTGFDFSLDMASVKRIEVIKGPGAALYGDNAIFGVINVVTNTADDAAPARAQAEGGSYGTHREFGEFSHKFKDDWQVYGQGSYRHMQGQNLTYPSMTDANGGSTAYNADREWNYTGYLSLSRPGWLLQGNVNNRYKQIPTGSFGDAFNNNGPYTVDSRSFLELAMTDRQITEHFKLSGRLYGDSYQYHGDYVYPNSTPPPPLVDEKDSVKAWWYGEELDAHFTYFGEKNPLLLGEEFENNVLGRQNTYLQDGDTLLNDNRTEHRYAFFGEQEVQLLSNLRMTLGLRYDRYEAFAANWAPRAALVYNPWTPSSFKLLYGTAFRAPNLYERFYAVSPNLSNPNLQPELIRTYEAVWEQQLGRAASTSVSYFQNRIHNLIDSVTLGTDINGNPISQFANVDSVRTDGVELSGKAAFTPDTSGHLGYCIQSTRALGGDRLSNSPTHIATLGLSQRLVRGKARVNVDGFILSSRTTLQGTPTTAPGPTLPAVALLSMNVRVQPWRESLTIYAGVRNVLNAAYSAPGSVNNLPQYDIPQDGRNFNAGLEYRFGKPPARKG
jgi:iron complex outermembrane receptor protein